MTAPSLPVHTPFTMAKPNNLPLLALLLLIVAAILPHASSQRRNSSQRRKPAYTEDERQAEYIKRGHSFPFAKYTPNTEGWKRLMDQRYTQVQALTNIQMKWDGWIQTNSAAVTVPNFTEYGWGLTQAPHELTEDIRQAIS